MSEADEIWGSPFIRLYQAGTDRTKEWINYSEKQKYNYLFEFLKENAKAGPVAEKEITREELI